MKIILLISLIFFCTLPAYAKKYAVVINGTDNYKLQASMDSLSAENAKSYQEQGYEVIIIDGKKGEGTKDFVNALLKLKNVEELYLSINTHRLADNAGLNKIGKESIAAELERFPKSYIRQDEVESHGEDNRDLKKYRMTGDVRFAYFINDKPGTQGMLGLSDLYNAVARLKQENPKMLTTLVSMSCFGGNASRALESIPDTQVFSATTSERYALGYDNKPDVEGKDKNPKDFVTYANYFQNNIDLGQSYLESHLHAKAKDLDAKLNKNSLFSQIPDTSYLSIPQSNLELIFSDMCIGSPPKTEVIECDFFNNRPTSLDLLLQNVSHIEIYSVMSELLNMEDQYFSTASQRLYCDEPPPPIPSTLISSARDEVVNIYNEMLSENFIEEQEKQLEDLKNAKTFEEFNAIKAPLFFKTFKNIIPNLARDFDLYKDAIILDYEKRLKNLAENGYMKDIQEHIESISEQNFSKCDLKQCDYDEIKKSWYFSESGGFFSKTKKIDLPFTNDYIDQPQFSIALNDPINKKFNELCKGKVLNRICVKSLKDVNSLERFALNASLYSPTYNFQGQFCESVKTLKNKNKKLRKCLENLDQKANPELLQKISNLIKIGSKKP
ncbi:MAG: hypothetical protein PHY93_10040 [Bacteriovorax sp.]|nr:hypothetical protein [Bacteriovorax sp.]